MPFMSLHAGVELFGDDEDRNAGLERDIETLTAHFSQGPDRPILPNAETLRQPFDNLRVAWEFYDGMIEAITVKIMVSAFENAPDAACRWIAELRNALPTMAPEIIGALAHGIVHLGFDCNFEGSTFCPSPGPSAHRRLAMEREAIATLTGRSACGIAGFLTENDDPRALPHLLNGLPLPEADR